MRSARLVPMTSRQVYVLTIEFDYEGSRILGVFASPEAAKRWLKDNRDFEGDWMKISNHEWVKVDSNSYYLIEAWDVNE